MPVKTERRLSRAASSGKWGLQPTVVAGRHPGTPRDNLKEAQMVPRNIKELSLVSSRSRVGKDHCKFLLPAYGTVRIEGVR